MSELRPIIRGLYAVSHEASGKAVELADEDPRGSAFAFILGDLCFRAAARLENHARAEAKAGPCQCVGGDVLEKPVGVFHCVGCGLPRPGWKAGGK